ncbi:HPr-like protein Crh [Peptococcaceae bacterium CEB3]|nr:HPr-like protein Crh [Peptococcaceae bacterium CEB3]
MEKEVLVLNKAGLHARPASVFVQEAGRYQADILIEKDGRSVNAKSIIGVLSLGIPQNVKIKLIAKGLDENEALEALVRLIEGKFGEE